jgi:hypothetical protein
MAVGLGPPHLFRAWILGSKEGKDQLLGLCCQVVGVKKVMTFHGQHPHSVEVAGGFSGPSAWRVIFRFLGAPERLFSREVVGEGGGGNRVFNKAHYLLLKQNRTKCTL